MAIVAIMIFLKHYALAMFLLLASATLVLAKKGHEDHPGSGKKMNRGSAFNNHGKPYPHVNASDQTSVDFLAYAISFSVAESADTAASGEQLADLSDAVGGSIYSDYSRSLAHTLGSLTAAEQSYIFSGE